MQYEVDRCLHDGERRSYDECGGHQPVAVCCQPTSHSAEGDRQKPNDATSATRQHRRRVWQHMFGVVTRSIVHNLHGIPSGEHRCDDPEHCSECVPHRFRLFLHQLDEGAERTFRMNESHRRAA